MIRQQQTNSSVALQPGGGDRSADNGQTDFGSNQANQEVLGGGDKDTPEPSTAELAKATPAVLVGKTDTDSGRVFATRCGAKPDELYEVTITWKELLAWGGEGELPGLSATGESNKGDFVGIDGKDMGPDGSVVNTLYVGPDDSRPVTFTLCNNGFLNLMRVARGAVKLAESFGGSPENDWALDDGTTLDILIGMKVGNDPKDVSSRDLGMLAGVDPQEITQKFNRALLEAAAASEAERLGPVDVKKPGIGIHESDIYASKFRDHSSTYDGMSWAEEAKAKLNADLIMLFTDRPGRTPSTYISGGLDFSAEIDQLFASNGYNNGGAGFDDDALVAFMDAVRKQLGQSVDLSWLENTEPAFKARFEAHWTDNIDQVFSGADKSRVTKERRKLPARKRYEKVAWEYEEPTAYMQSNGSGRTDGEGGFRMPDMAGWGHQPEDKEDVDGIFEDPDKGPGPGTTGGPTASGPGLGEGQGPGTDGADLGQDRPPTADELAFGLTGLDGMERLVDNFSDDGVMHMETLHKAAKGVLAAQWAEIGMPDTGRLSTQLAGEVVRAWRVWLTAMQEGQGADVIGEARASLDAAVAALG